MRKIPIVTDSLLLDTLSLVPGSLAIAQDSSSYYINYGTSQFVWINRPSIDSIFISYRVFPFLISKKYFHKDLGRNYETNIAFSPYYYGAEDIKPTGPFVDFGTINYAGTFGRALSFGNSQDVVLNSQFNLQMEGDLGDSIKIRGSITDNTIPFQPEGNTQQIQEFDRVSIELERKNAKLIAGDFDIRKPTSYFMNFYKRVQGGFFETKNKTKTGENKLSTSISFAKGKWVRNAIVPLEGNQGPYKLIGPNGETFFIVLANSERVYIDGIQMQRGEDKDYIIDYNTAEVVFMPRRLITKDLRIFVEFEFVDRNYLNSLVYVSDDFKVNDKLSIRLSAYSNQDAKNQPIQADLDSTRKAFLGTVGNNIAEALYPSVRLDDTFSVEKILYKKVDTLVLGIMYSNVYVFSTSPDSARYKLNFSFVGPGRGNYKQSINNANGRVYAWVAPLNGQAQGDYEPVEVLVTPKRQQLFVIGADYQIDSNKHIMFESALSHYDPNSFSIIDNNKNIGTAQKIIYVEKRNLNTAWQTSAELNYEYVQAQFKPIERFRNVEFIRDWNLTDKELPADEHIGKVSLLLSKKNILGVGYTFGTFIRGASYEGFQHIPLLFYKQKGWNVRITANTIHQSSLVAKTNFFRPKLEIERSFEKLNLFTLGASYLKEDNTYRNPTNDTLLPTAFAFNEYRVYARTNSDAEKQVSLAYLFRNDFLKKENELDLANYSHNLSLGGQLLSLKDQQIKLTSTYRLMHVVDSLISPQKGDESLLGRLEYNFGFLKGLLSGNMLYEFGSGQEQKREFAYVEVPAGQGIYVWRDYNADGLRQLNEFELANFPDEKRFIKIFTPTNQYVKAKYSEYNQSIIFNPRNLWKKDDSKGIKKTLSYFYFQSNIQLQNRFIGEQGLAQYNPFLFNFADSVLINNAANFTHSIFFNRFSNKWGIDYVQSSNAGKTLLNYGVDSRKNTEHLLRARWNLTKQIAFNQNLKSGVKTSLSQFLTGRNFEIAYQSIEPSFTFLMKRNQIRISSTYKYDLRNNAPQYGDQRALSQSGSLDVKFNIPSSGSINARTTYNIINFDGDPNSGIGYSMLDGLRNGKNYLWEIMFDKKISQNIEMSIQYEGRKPGSGQSIHTGRATVRAIF